MTHPTDKIKCFNSYIKFLLVARSYLFFFAIPYIHDIVIQYQLLLIRSYIISGSRCIHKIIECDILEFNNILFQSNGERVGSILKPLWLLRYFLFLSGYLLASSLYRLLEIHVHFCRSHCQTVDTPNQIGHFGKCCFWRCQLQ